MIFIVLAQIVHTFIGKQWCLLSAFPYLGRVYPRRGGGRGVTYCVPHCLAYTPSFGEGTAIVLSVNHAEQCVDRYITHVPAWLRL